MEDLESQQVVTIPSSHEKRCAVIFLHGLGQSNLTWSIVVVEALAPMLPHVEWIIPQAPARPVTMNQGQLRPSWFDLSRMPPPDHEYDEVGIAESTAAIENLVLTQVHSGVDPSQIVLVGFSQGAALGMLVSLTTLYELGGVASLSGWIPRQVRSTIHFAPSIPIFWAHGTADLDIPIEFAEDGLVFLRHTLGIPKSLLQYTEYEGLGHTISDDELEDLSLWLIRVLE